MIMKFALIVIGLSILFHVTTKAFGKWDKRDGPSVTSNHQTDYYGQWSEYSHHRDPDYRYRGINPAHTQWALLAAVEQRGKEEPEKYLYVKSYSVATNFWSRLAAMWNELDVGKQADIISVPIVIVLVTALFTTISSISISVSKASLVTQRAYAEDITREVEEIVFTYMEHEKILLTKDVSVEALVITYPELRSVELINTQIETLREVKKDIYDLEASIIFDEAFINWAWGL